MSRDLTATAVSLNAAAAVNITLAALFDRGPGVRLLPLVVALVLVVAAAVAVVYNRRPTEPTVTMPRGYSIDERRLLAAVLTQALNHADPYDPDQRTYQPGGPTR